MRRVALALLTGLALLVATVAKTAVQLNKDALALAYKNELRQALPIFKQAARKDPTNAEYLNNIGVTEMRLGQLDEAKRYFELALEHSPSNEDARLNLAELLDFIQKRDRIDNGDVVQKEYEKHKTIPLPHIHIDDFYKPEYTSFHTGKRPFILQGLASGWKGAEKWDLDYLEALFPNSTVDFYPHNMHKETVRPFIVPLPEAFSEFRDPSGRYRTSPDAPGTYIQWNMKWEEWKRLSAEFGAVPEIFETDEAWLTGCLPSDAFRTKFMLDTHWRMVLIGSKGAGMFNHIDTLRTASYQVQVVGAKKWHLCGPEQSPFVYKAGMVNTLRPDYAKYPLFSNARCYEDVVKQGEMAFYPRDYWHQTENLGDLNIAVTGTLVDQHNWREVASEMKSDCQFGKNKILQATPEMCEALEVCFDWWQAAYEGDGFVVGEAAEDEVCEV